MIRALEREQENKQLTCYGCIEVNDCRCAWDAYNTKLLITKHRGTYGFDNKTEWLAR